MTLILSSIAVLALVEADPIWINGTIAQFIHDDQIAAHGGAYGLLNAGMLATIVSP